LAISDYIGCQQFLYAVVSQDIYDSNYGLIVAIMTELMKAANEAEAYRAEFIWLRRTTVS
jgi:oligoribonuclease NrnB/cAMP/cGMP phosphodiesterase (DHH superfamily)